MTNDKTIEVWENDTEFHGLMEEYTDQIGFQFSPTLGAEDKREYCNALCALLQREMEEKYTKEKKKILNLVENVYLNKKVGVISVGDSIVNISDTSLIRFTDQLIEVTTISKEV